MMVRSVALAALLGCVSAWAAAPPVTGAGAFTKEQLAWLDRNADEVEAHGQAGRFEEAEGAVRECLRLHERVLGRDHWQTRDERLIAEEWRRLANVPKARRKEVGRAIELQARGAQS